MTDPIFEAVAQNPSLRERIENVQAVSRRIARAREAELPTPIGSAPAVAGADPAPTGIEPLGPILERIVAKSEQKWARKSSTEQAMQRIDELADKALPGFLCRMNVGQPHYPPGNPPFPADGAVAALRDVYAMGAADDLDDPAIRSTVRNRLEAHWMSVLEQREKEAKQKPRERVRSGWPTRKELGAGVLLACACASLAAAGWLS